MKTNCIDDGHSLPRALLVHWYAPLLGGLVPLLLLGFGYSALADRLAFLYWALAMGTAWVLVLRHGLEAGWSALRRAGSLGLLLAAGLAAFAALEVRHGEILDLGFRAVLPGIYHPVATRPATAGVFAAVFAVLGGASLLAGLRRRKVA